MKRALRWLLGMGLVLGGRPAARAQASPGAQARVYTVTDQGRSALFEVPQVRLPNAAVARRINRQLLRGVTSYFSTPDSAASPRRQLTQAARECCYDADARRWRAGGDGLTAFYYEVLLNQNYLLSFSFAHDWQGLTQPATSHLTFDLRTGRVLTLPELVADPPAQLGRRLAAAVSRRLRDELSWVAARYGDDSARIAHVAELYDIGEWNTTPQRGLRLDTADGSEADLSEFALRPDALLLFHPVGMSRLDFEFLPDETYVFPYERLQPRALLRPLLQAERQQKKTGPQSK